MSFSKKEKKIYSPSGFKTGDIDPNWGKKGVNVLLEPSGTLEVEPVSDDVDWEYHWWVKTLVRRIWQRV